MLKKFKTHINKNFPFLFGKKLLIAISGGVDSIVLTHLCSTLKKTEISLAHCNFKLRENESDKDEYFVKTLGEKLHLKTFTIQFDTNKYAQDNKLSTQLTARKLRYDWFDELSKKHQFDYVLTAHHADDNLETFLINLTRGTGLDGLIGIPSKNGNIVRPLLTFSREEIIQYATKNHIEWREDASNSETKYLRNKIRHEIVPKLKEINPNLLDSFDKTSEFLQQSQQIIDDNIKNISKDIISQEHDVIQFDIKKIKQLSNPKAYLYQFLKSYGFTAWNDINNLLYAQSGKQVFSASHRLLKNRDFLLLTKKQEFTSNKDCFKIKKDTKKIEQPIQLSFTTVSKNPIQETNSIIVDKDLLKYPLIVRKWEKGDYFCPDGMLGSKKLSKYFKDEKFSLFEKEQTWLLCSAKNEIIWIIGKRKDRRFLPLEKSNNYLKITIN